MTTERSLKVQEALLCGFTQAVLAYAAWHAFLMHMGLWAAFLAVLFGLLAAFQHPGRVRRYDPEENDASLRHRPGHRPRRP